MNSKAQLQQDLFVQDVLQNKFNGYFLDIGCQDPEEISNTFSLEKEFNWTGIGIDITLNKEKWQSLRPNTKVFELDALKIDYNNFLKENNVPTIVDYFNLDLEPPQITLDCLKLIPFENYTFKVITFETDRYRCNIYLESREIFKKYNYRLISEVGFTWGGAFRPQDEFYVHESIAEEYLSRKNNGT